MTPRQISRYEVKRELGQGGMSAVYLAHDPRFKRDVAIKALFAPLSQDPQFRARFEREVQTTAVLEHSAIVPVYDFGEEDNLLFLVMRYMPGGSLKERIPRRGMLLPHIQRTIQRASEALDHAHQEGVIHRDLKPDNILFDQYDKAYLGDFGIAKLMDSNERLTTQGVIGTYLYMSPEQLDGKPLDKRSDIYSLGLILYEMLTGRPPFNADTLSKLIMSRKLDPLPTLAERRGDLPAGYEEVVRRALAEKPSERFETAHDLAEELAIVMANAKFARPTHMESTADQTLYDAHPLIPPPAPPPLPSKPAPADATLIDMSLDEPVKPVYVPPVQSAKMDETLIDKSFGDSAVFPTPPPPPPPASNDEFRALTLDGPRRGAIPLWLKVVTGVLVIAILLVSGFYLVNSGLMEDDTGATETAVSANHTATAAALAVLPTATRTPNPTTAATATATVTLTTPSTATATRQPSATPTPDATETPIPTETPTETPTVVVAAVATPRLLSLPCTTTNNFNTTQELDFRWSFSGTLRNGEYLEVRVGPQGASAGFLTSQGRGTLETGQNWFLRIPVTQFFTTNTLDYHWEVVHMSANGRNVVARSPRGCFHIDP